MTDRQILYITPYVPSPIRVRSYNLIRSLAARGHRLQVVALQTAEEEAEDARRLQAIGIPVLAVPHEPQDALLGCADGLARGWPLQAALTHSRVMLRAVAAQLGARPYDVVHVEHLRGASLGLACRERCAVWDAVDCISLLLERTRAGGPSLKYRLLARLDLARTRRFEGQAQSWYERVLLTSAEDRDALLGLAVDDAGAAGRLRVLGNGVDLAHFGPDGRPREPETVVLTGKMSYHANIAAALDLAQQVMPHLWRESPHVRLRIVGQDPPPAIRRLARDPRIEVTSSVPDLRPYLAQATVAVCPLRYGVGTQNKVLEALAMGTPVVSTAQACRALAAIRPGEHLLVADGPEALAGQIRAVLQSPDLAAALGRRGRSYVERHHDWSAVAGQLETIYEEAIAQWAERSRS